MRMNNKIKNVVCFGEILWDILPTASLPGGAPMNVAYHLKKLGNNAELISKIGDDEWGQKLLSLLHENHINTGFIETDRLLSTGKVNATIGEDNEVSYEIVKPVAWDNIEWQQGFEHVVRESDYFVFGSLAARSDVSRKTLFRLISFAKNKVMDVNLRAPHYTKELLECLLPDLHLLKMNEEELVIISNWFFDFKEQQDRMNALQDKFKIPHIVVTKGGAGAVYNCKGKYYNQDAFKVKVADTIGSGDCFLAAFLTGLSNNDSPQYTLQFACAAGALIASYSGACPDYNVAEVTSLIKNNVA
jgi:fructokinase